MQSASSEVTSSIQRWSWVKTVTHKCQSRLTHCGKRDGYSRTSSARASSGDPRAKSLRTHTHTELMTVNPLRAPSVPTMVRIYAPRATEYLEMSHYRRCLGP